MEAFTFEQEQVETSIGIIDVYFDVQFEIISDETGRECEWEPDHTIYVTSFDEDGNQVDLVAKRGEPLFYEILKQCEDSIIEECYDNASEW